MIEPRYQTFWPRFWAGFLDALVFFPFAMVSMVAYREAVPIPLRVIWYLTSAFAFLAYVVLMHARYGQTLGKMATHVKVLDVSESTGLPLRREVVVHFPQGDMTVVESYSLRRPVGGASVN